MPLALFSKKRNTSCFVLRVHWLFMCLPEERLSIMVNKSLWYGLRKLLTCQLLSARGDEEFSSRSSVSKALSFNVTSELDAEVESGPARPQQCSAGPQAAFAEETRRSAEIGFYAESLEINSTGSTMPGGFHAPQCIRTSLAREPADTTLHQGSAASLRGYLNDEHEQISASARSMICEYGTAQEGAEESSAPASFPDHLPQLPNSITLLDTERSSAPTTHLNTSSPPPPHQQSRRDLHLTPLPTDNSTQLTNHSPPPAAPTTNTSSKTSSCLLPLPPPPCAQSPTVAPAARTWQDVHHPGGGSRKKRPPPAHGGIYNHLLAQQWEMATWDGSNLSKPAPDSTCFSTLLLHKVESNGVIEERSDEELVFSSAGNAISTSGSGQVGTPVMRMPAQHAGHLSMTWSHGIPEQHVMHHAPPCCSEGAGGYEGVTSQDLSSMSHDAEGASGSYAVQLPGQLPGHKGDIVVTERCRVKPGICADYDLDTVLSCAVQEAAGAEEPGSVVAVSPSKHARVMALLTGRPSSDFKSSNLGGHPDPPVMSQALQELKEDKPTPSTRFAVVGGGRLIDGASVTKVGNNIPSTASSSLEKRRPPATTMKTTLKGCPPPPPTKFITLDQFRRHFLAPALKPGAAALSASTAPQGTAVQSASAETISAAQGVANAPEPGRANDSNTTTHAIAHAVTHDGSQEAPMQISIKQNPALDSINSGIKWPGLPLGHRATLQGRQQPCAGNASEKGNTINRDGARQYSGTKRGPVRRLKSLSCMYPLSSNRSFVNPSGVRCSLESHLKPAPERGGGMNAGVEYEGFCTADSLLGTGKCPIAPQQQRDLSVPQAAQQKALIPIASAVAKNVSAQDAALLSLVQPVKIKVQKGPFWSAQAQSLGSSPLPHSSEAPTQVHELLRSANGAQRGNIKRGATQGALSFFPTVSTSAMRSYPSTSRKSAASYKQDTASNEAAAALLAYNRRQSVVAWESHTEEQEEERCQKEAMLKLLGKLSDESSSFLTRGSTSGFEDHGGSGGTGSTGPASATRLQKRHSTVHNGSNRGGATTADHNEANLHPQGGAAAAAAAAVLSKSASSSPRRSIIGEEQQVLLVSSSPESSNGKLGVVVGSRASRHQQCSSPITQLTFTDRLHGSGGSSPLSRSAVPPGGPLAATSAAGRPSSSTQMSAGGAGSCHPVAAAVGGGISWTSASRNGRATSHLSRSSMDLQRE
ncbi:hypothetical protein CEUSTIGMA_g10318.t1 [Chlamydomonas eustigma]|uniref:Uncharacterized protein n=1 Tax=Chlamydomonas eustigma TaxID=1157962 RepID=A0A250XJ04_9CHLO|nr:hypothetical protein CEUSTIGMA_g10318.t1 [Chlamydomonas eustigma]|eukprot:GAX82892.1 hypothetical protein CEUSTIGMA_g10318.t1 [Chlamydomonas eustigma]